jgi:hypothetical protein
MVRRVQELVLWMVVPTLLKLEFALLPKTWTA